MESLCFDGIIYKNYGTLYKYHDIYMKLKEYPDNTMEHPKKVLLTKSPIDCHRF